MPRTVWRIAADTAHYGSDDLSGKGAEKTGGRWNRRDTPVIYASGSIALAYLETIVHLSGNDPLPHPADVVESVNTHICTNAPDSQGRHPTLTAAC
jgi:RES domain-containing protein